MIYASNGKGNYNKILCTLFCLKLLKKTFSFSFHFCVNLQKKTFSFPFHFVQIYRKKNYTWVKGKDRRRINQWWAGTWQSGWWRRNNWYRVDKRRKDGRSRWWRTYRRRTRLNYGVYIWCRAWISVWRW